MESHSAYLSNWNLLQNYFQGDSALPTPKRTRITGIDDSIPHSDQVVTISREVYRSEPLESNLVHPHEWFKGEASTSMPAILKDNSKGKGIADDNN